MIVVDIQAAQSLSSGHRGIGRYTRQLVGALLRRHPEVVDAYCWNDRLPADTSVHDVVPDELLVSSAELAGRTIDVLHVASPFERMALRRLLPNANVRGLMATCFDLIPYRFPERYLGGRERADYVARLGLLHACDEIVTDSASAANDCIELLGIRPERLTVIGGGVDDVFQPPTDSLAERMAALRVAIPGLRAGYLLVPTGMDWRKNTEGAIAAYAALPAAVQRRHQLVIACKVTNAERRWIDEQASGLGMCGEMLVSGFVRDDDLVRLYQSAELVVFPSKYEGFGLPVLEARRCGARVICSNVSSLPEVMPLPEATFNPWSIEDIAAVMGRALTDAAFAARLDAAPDPGFDFDLAADRTVEVYQRLASRVRRRRAARPRLAVVTLLPPTPSGVADHSAALLDELRHIADVTCFVADDIFPAGTTPRPYPVRRLALLPTMSLGGNFDAVIYCMGNNRFHRPFIDMLEQVPGHVLFHDARLTNCWSGHERRSIALECYAGVDDPLYAAPVAALATTCLVQSAHAADLLHDDCGVAATVVGPHPMAPAPAVPAGGGEVRLLSLGIASTAKQSEKFVAAARLLLERHPSWRATLAGDGAGAFAVDTSVESLPALGEAEFLAWFGRATVLVQLRNVTNGESSGVVAHALARGVPTVVTDLGAQAELPDDAVLKVPREIPAADLASEIEALVADEPRRRRMTAAAKAFAAGNTYAAQARRVVEAVSASPARVPSGAGRSPAG